MQDRRSCKQSAGGISLVVGGNFGSRDFVLLIPRVGLLEKRPAVSGGPRENTTRRVALSSGERHSLMIVLLVSSLGEGDDHLTAKLCPFRVIERAE